MFQSAVCCSDGQHCCPQGYTCDVSAGTCIKQDQIIPFMTKVQAKAPQVICPDGQTQCPDGNTCCRLLSGQWGCCPLPFPNAVCCSDRISCCPQGYTCDSAGTCTMLDQTIPLMMKAHSAVCCSDGQHCCPQGYVVAKAKNVVCPGGKSQCPEDNTCCKLVSGDYGCCPLPNAVCCSDRLHCCPEGYTCDVSAGTCTKQGQIIPFIPKRPSSSVYGDDLWLK
jgi:hypothetical protein